MRVFVVCLLMIACGQPAQPNSGATATVIPLPKTDEDCGVDRYELHAAWDGGKPVLPVPPTLSNAPIKLGDAYTIYGAMHELQMNPSVFAKDVTIVGVIVDSNVTRAPKCALHKTGKADPEKCVTEVPTFRIADTAGDKISIPVMGWASNFANVYDAYHSTKPWDDMLWAVRVPVPLPAVGARVRVTGRYAVSFTKSSSGMASEPRTGILTYASIDVLEPSPTPIKLSP